MVISQRGSLTGTVVKKDIASSSNSSDLNAKDMCHWSYILQTLQGCEKFYLFVVVCRSLHRTPEGPSQHRRVCRQ
jgi:hypothetical protein